MAPRKAPRRDRAPGRRREIQGLRALAVGAVVVDHLTGWPGGGFVGVDIFFVISGFLITGLLLSEHRRTGRISLAGFYMRRVRRIVPATLLVVVVTVAASFYLLNAGRGRQTAVDALWSLLFSGNWRFAATGTDYFQTGGPRSPLEHFWSLGVEEQFYLVWPWLIVGVFALVSGRVADPARFGRFLLGVALTFTVVTSFGYACRLGVANPTLAYFSTLTRGWELGIGALLALTTPLLASIPSVWRPALAWLGLAAIAASFWIIDENTPFPGPWSALPVLSTAMVIAAGTGAQPRYLLPLTNRLMVWIGELSYSLYLWHFPVIILMASVLDEASVRYYVCCAVLTSGLAVAAYYGLENPVRRSSWLTGRRTVDPRRRAPRRRPVGFRRIAGVGGLAVASLLFVGVAVDGQPSSGAAAPPAPPSATGASGSSTVAAGERAAAVHSALAATAWPDLQPGLATVNGAVASTPCALTYTSQPLFGVPEIEERCLQGDAAARHRVLVIGDSLANSYLPAVLAAVKPLGAHVIGLSRPGCPAYRIDVVQVVSRVPYRVCSEHQELLAKRVAELAPDLIVVSSSPDTPRYRLASRATGEEALAEWQRAAEASLAQFAESAPVVVLQAPPRGADIKACASRFSTPADCVSTPAPHYFDFGQAEQRAARALEDSAVTYEATQEWFCSAEGFCPAFVEQTPLFADGGHLTVDAARALAPAVRAVLEPFLDE